MNYWQFTLTVHLVRVVHNINLCVSGGGGRSPPAEGAKEEAGGPSQGRRRQEEILDGQVSLRRKI